VNLPDRVPGEGYQETILNKKNSLLIKTDSVTTLADSVLDHPGGIPQSMLAVPFLVGDRANGVISILISPGKIPSTRFNLSFSPPLPAR